MVTILLLGLLIGMQHALDADHIAAVATLAARKSSTRNFLRHGVTWGVGHAVTLMLVASAALYFEFTIHEKFSVFFEVGVGVLLAGLGGHLLFCLRREKVHFHLHRHENGILHFHAHSHQGDTQTHNILGHVHDHPRGLPIRTLIVGMMHGLAGSAALLIMAAAVVKDLLNGILYVGMFGVGSVFGMAILSVLIAIPMRYSARVMASINRGLQHAIALCTLIFGGVIFIHSILTLII